MKAALSLETLLILIVMAMPKILDMPAKKFEATVRHAQTCIPDKLTICCPQNIEVLNAVGETTGQISDYEHAGSSKLTASAVAPQGVDSSDLDASHSNTSFWNASSPINPTGLNAIEKLFRSIDSRERLGSYPTACKPWIITYTNDHIMDELLSSCHAVDSCNSQTVYVRDPKKSWRALFAVSAVSKWLSRRKRTAPFDESLGQKKQRIR